MTVYRWSPEDGDFFNKRTGERMTYPKRAKGEIVAPMVMRDVPEYRSPIDGKLISSRSTQREDMKKNGCVPFEPLTNRPRGCGNPKMAAKYGVTFDEAAAHRPRSKRIDPLAAVRANR